MSFGKFPTYLALLVFFTVFQEQVLAIKQTYVVYLGGHSHGPEVTASDLQRVTDLHTEFLASFLGSHDKAKDAMITSYKRYINGFAALLEEEEAADIAEHPDVVSVFPDQGKKLMTTRSWDFLQVEKNGVIQPSSAWRKARFGEDTIIATLDTGVWPESRSFSGKGYGPIPARWSGTCELADKSGVSLCNRKLLGARYFNKGYAADVREKYGTGLNASEKTARDMAGHGTHTLSTAAGNFVPGANVFGVGNGIAKGGSPRARAASYRVCYPTVEGSECFNSDILEGYEAAIHDGVDVISVSLGGDPADYFDDSIAIGAFHAVQNGRVVVAAGGNSGPTPGTVSNVAPWIITVAASSIDRVFEANVKLATGQVFQGASLSLPMPQGRLYPFISGAQAAAANVSQQDAILCRLKSLDPKKVKGKVVVCLRGDNPRIEKGEEAVRAGAAGMVLCNDKIDGDSIIADPHFLPAVHVNYTDGQIIFRYVNHTRNPRGILLKPKTVLGVQPAPVVANFSSRGPNIVTPEILKPDVSAPGLDIIASFSKAVHPTDMPYDNRTNDFMILSGTSMACPHVSGVAGLLKTLYPEWSPGAIRSAIMTTAKTTDNTDHTIRDQLDYNEATSFAFGSGNIRPNLAVDPGLVYDVGINDYLDFLCGLGYNQTMISLFSGTSYNCPDNYSILDFNNPSFSIPNLNGSATVTRTLKNVGKPGTYVAHVRTPPGYTVSVQPTVLRFERVGEEKSFKVRIGRNAKGGDELALYARGQLTWTDGNHSVRSPIVLGSARP